MFWRRKIGETNGFIRLTRVYGRGKENIKTQPIMVAVSEIESFRPRNKTKGNRCTLVTNSGKYINVAEKFSEVRRLLTQSA